MKINFRQNTILSLIQKQEISTQEELLERLLDVGIETTQATLSRDIKKLGLQKIQNEEKRNYYSTDTENKRNVTNKMMRMFKESVVSIDTANNLLVIKTLAGSANSSGVLLDNISFGGYMCCICGDDAVLAVFKDNLFATRAEKQLLEIITN